MVVKRGTSADFWQLVDAAVEIDQILYQSRHCVVFFNLGMEIAVV
jgi:hypothetical protein